MYCFWADLPTLQSFTRFPGALSELLEVQMFPLVEESVVVLIDWQHRLLPAMPDCRVANQQHAENILWLSQQLSVPVVVTEQYPKGLGHTVAELLVYLSSESRVIEKRDFSAAAVPEFTQELERLGRSNVILIGMETHICVAQSASELLAGGYKVWVAADAVLSRRTLDWRFGLSQMQRKGAFITTTEALLFGWIGRAEGEVFKAFSRRIR